MQQAIEEGYILDVLKGYQSYDTALKIAGKARATTAARSRRRLRGRG